jgi:hypothetical protein
MINMLLKPISRAVRLWAQDKSQEKVSNQSVSDQDSLSSFANRRRDSGSKAAQRIYNTLSTGGWGVV